MLLTQRLLVGGAFNQCEFWKEWLSIVLLQCVLTPIKIVLKISVHSRSSTEVKMNPAIKRKEPELKNQDGVD